MNISPKNSRVRKFSAAVAGALFLAGAGAAASASTVPPGSDAPAGTMAEATPAAPFELEPVAGSITGSGATFPAAFYGEAIAELQAIAPDLTIEYGGGGSGILLRPVAVPVSSPFSRRFHPIFHEWRLHAGVDLSAPCGTPIRAAEEGRVTHVGFDSSGGWRLVIDHGPVGGRSVATTYLHAQGYRVRPGDRVARGQVVGTVGSTGWSTGCHLHLGVRADGRVVDPAVWLG